MTYRIADFNLDLIAQGFKTEENAIRRVILQIPTDKSPVFVQEDNLEITALIYCGVVYRPADEHVSVK